MGSTHHVNIGAYITRFNGRMTDFKRGVLLKLFGAVIKDTPVDTGRLRNAWTFSKGKPPTEFAVKYNEDDAAYPKGVVQPNTASPRVTTQVQEQVQVKDGDMSYYLANNMPYVVPIEYGGHSTIKSPQGMVRKNVIRIQANLKAQVDLEASK